MYQNYYPQHQDERFFPFLAPFLLGGIGGAAVMAAARPRIYPVPYYPAQYQMPMPYQIPYKPYNYNYYGGYNYY